MKLDEPALAVEHDRPHVGDRERRNPSSRRCRCFPSAPSGADCCDTRRAGPGAVPCATGRGLPRLRPSRARTGGNRLPTGIRSQCPPAGRCTRVRAPHRARDPRGHLETSRAADRLVTSADSVKAAIGREKQQRHHQAEDGGARRQRAGFAGRGHHLRRRRFAGRERRRQRIPAGQRCRDRQRGRWPISRVVLETTEDRPIDRRIQISNQLRGWDDSRFALAQQLRDVPGLDGALAGEQLVEDQPQRIDVAPDGDLTACELLRRHVGRRAGPERFTRNPGKTEVGDPHAARAVDHHVRGLQIPVDDAPLVGGAESRAHLAGQFERALDRESPDAAQERRQFLAVHVFHREECVAVDLVDVVYAADVRVRDLPCHPHLVVELHQARRIVIEVRRQELERYRLRELQVVSAIDLAHAAAAEASDDAVPAAEHRAKRKASVVDGVRGGQPSRRRRDVACWLSARRVRASELCFDLGDPCFLVGRRHVGILPPGA